MPFELDMTKLRYGTDLVKRGFAKMQQGGVVMDVTTWWVLDKATGVLRPQGAVYFFAAPAAARRWTLKWARKVGVTPASARAWLAEPEHADDPYRPLYETVAAAPELRSR